MLMNFDKRFLLLIFPLLRNAWPWLQYQGREVIPFAMLALFIVSFFGERQPQVSDRVRVAFWWMLFCYFLFAFSNSIFALISYGEFLKYHEYATMISTIGYLYVFYLGIIHKKYTELKILLVIVLIGTLLAGYSAGSAGEMTSRQLLLNSVSREDSNSMYNAYDAAMSGLGGYGFIYANAASAGLVLLIAMSRSLKKGFRVLFGIAFIAMLIIVKKGGLGTATAVAWLSTVLALLTLIGRSVRTLKIVGALACVLFLVYAFTPKMLSPLSGPLMWIAESMDSGAIQDRFVSAAQSVSGDEYSYAYERAQLFVRSTRVFLDNPFIGVGAYQEGHVSGDKLGGHSVIMDMLAQQGMIGLILIIMFFMSAFKFFREISLFCNHPNWNALPSIYLLCLLYMMFSNQAAKSISGLFLIIVFGYLSMLMQTNPNHSNRFCKYERWRI